VRRAFKEGRGTFLDLSMHFDVPIDQVREWTRGINPKPRTGPPLAVSDATLERHLQPRFWSPTEEDLRLTRSGSAYTVTRHPVGDAMLTVAEAASRFGVLKATIKSRMGRGQTLAQAVDQEPCPATWNAPPATMAKRCG
jgi:hypothetical protein